jgi:hypothetical protein
LGVVCGQARWVTINQSLLMLRGHAARCAPTPHTRSVCLARCPSLHSPAGSPRSPMGASCHSTCYIIGGECIHGVKPAVTKTLPFPRTHTHAAPDGHAAPIKLAPCLAPVGPSGSLQPLHTPTTTIRAYSSALPALAKQLRQRGRTGDGRQTRVRARANSRRITPPYSPPAAVLAHASSFRLHPFINPNAHNTTRAAAQGGSTPKSPQIVTWPTRTTHKVDSFGS